MPTTKQEGPMNNIRIYREGLGLTQNDLALRTQIPAPTLRRYEKSSVKISAVNQKIIAEALTQPIDILFPDPAQKRALPSSQYQMNRREFLGAAAITGTGLSMVGLSPFMLTNPAFNKSRKEFSKDELNILAEENYGLWELLNALQRGTSINFVSSVAQGKLLTLQHLSQGSLLPTQHNMLLNFLADVYVLLGRICQEVQDYGSGEAYFREALSIAQETGNVDLKTATRQRYGYMLINQERYRAALQNAEIGIEEGKSATFPIWGEIQLCAAECYAYTGNISKARTVAARARNINRGRDPEIWFGKLLNPKTSYIKNEIVINLAAQHNDEAIRASEDALHNLEKEEPDNLTWRASLQELQARALWQFGRHEESMTTAKESLMNARKVGSVVTETKIEKLHHQMENSPLRTRYGVQVIGELLASS
ncbi:MAG: helix-turn-helix domain-containing protein [Ktedonobacterales bacterium]|nr:helix-turn-helix domain-containing protein [Ktedonobacterales bacterium]